MHESPRIIENVSSGQRVLNTSYKNSSWTVDWTDCVSALSHSIWLRSITEVSSVGSSPSISDDASTPDLRRSSLLCTSETEFVSPGPEIAFEAIYKCPVLPCDSNGLLKTLTQFLVLHNGEVPVWQLENAFARSSACRMKSIKLKFRSTTSDWRLFTAVGLCFSRFRLVLTAIFIQYLPHWVCVICGRSLADMLR